ncbi:virulence-associated E family protein [Siphonobacter sp. SORGH_AS_1065]|uniref:virulence-associated E family protein n=1 Tax=Siphonobacter sp. SORGH_AS_1065 TaxID=3041795 RepID=UPI00278243DD|nr:virulence-associated E family protein [Siphonobacter sp. SORGH_AS_1065]MDQ1088593.1 putative DNA primase/helicase [Siphonobacter sp. SORGH_AS_1065]
MSKIDIAVGKHRNEKNWKNKSVEWSDFVKKCSVTHRTSETLAVFMSSPKSRQDEIKDVGAFVGGYLANGRRKKESVVHRQLITLDADFASKDFWFDFCLNFSCAAILYSTHKYTSEKPRVRLIIPLDRTVTPDEYEAIARKIAGMVGIDQFDHTTYQANRLMYWPSTSSDAEFVFEEQEGEFLEADSILELYHDWKDTSEWPVGDAETAAIKTGIKRQGDPTEKEGVIGAFCRIYGIDEAIEAFLSDVYEPCDVENRYTFKGGTTAAGVIVYENKWAYSHHGTDPTSGKLCNAFDLVRIHLKGHLDEDKEANTPVNKLPSYLAMQEFASKDEQVKKLMLTERLQSAREDFSGVDDEDNEEDLSWLPKLDIDNKGKLLPTTKNFRLIMENDPQLKGCLATDSFAKREVALKDLPWRKVTKGEFLTDADSNQLREFIESKYGLPVISKTFSFAEANTFDNNRFHPVKEYLSSLVWDGVERVETLLTTYVGAEDNELTRAMIRKVMAAAVARIYTPGCKFDYVLTFAGDEGGRKTTFITILGGDWFSNSFGDINKEKVAEESLQGVWLMEIGELDGFKRGSVEKVKHFITKQNDQYRVAYGRRKEVFPRQTVFFATTNEVEFLVSTTGNRRFWVVDTKKVWSENLHERLEAERDQIWAEAVQIFKKGEKLYLSDELEAEAKKRTEAKEVHDPRDERIQWYLDSLLPENWDMMSIFERRSFLNTQNDPDPTMPKGTVLRTKVCAAEIWCEAFEGNHKDMNAFNTRFIKDYMRRKAKGWEAYKSISRFGMYGAQRGYFLVCKDSTLDKSAYKEKKEVHTTAYKSNT